MWLEMRARDRTGSPANAARRIKEADDLLPFGSDYVVSHGPYGLTAQYVRKPDMFLCNTDFFDGLRTGLESADAFELAWKMKDGKAWYTIRAKLPPFTLLVLGGEIAAISFLLAFPVWAIASYDFVAAGLIITLLLISFYSRTERENRRPLLYDFLQIWRFLRA